MEIVWAIAGLLFVLLIHEFGHAGRMVKCGVEVEEIGLGLPIPGLPRLRIPLGAHRPAFCIHPFLIGAYVKPSKAGEAQMNELWEEDQAYIFRGGIFYNAISGLMFLLAGFIIQPPEIPSPSFRWTWQIMFTILGVLGVIAIFVFLWRRARWVFGILLIGMVAYGSVMLTGKSYMSIGGLIQQFVGMTSSLHEMLTGLGAISVSIALLNYLPVPPMDGWRLAKLREPTSAVKGMKLGNLEAVLLIGLLLETAYGFVHDIVLFLFFLIQE